MVVLLKKMMKVMRRKIMRVKKNAVVADPLVK
jgi:hypothetical protein